MKNLIQWWSIVLLVCLFFSCGNSIQITEQAKELIAEGNFDEASSVIVQKILPDETDSVQKDYWQNQLEWMRRMKIEFSVSGEDAKKVLTEYYPALTDSMMESWENSGDLEMRIIDGEKRYFNRAVSNFFRINKQAKEVKALRDGTQLKGVSLFQQRYLPELFETGKAVKGQPFDKREIELVYTIRLKANAVPAGEIVRCWMPYPRTGLQNLFDLELLGHSEAEYVIAPDSCHHRTIYMEKPAVLDSATVFQVSYRFRTAALWYDLRPEEVKAYDVNSDLYRKYTAERLPHIILSDTIRNLARSIVGAETNSVEQVRLLYYWLNDHIPWAGALEYSVMECIPEYVLQHHRGDCGMQTFLFLSMARSLGIPCRWQSGWYLMPEEKNLHDWAEVYYEGIGWVPLDASFKLVDSPDLRIHEFFMNGLDSYRLIVNNDVARDLFPAKKYMRSEPFDFQRGELEWRNGNLYFDTWTYSMQINKAQ